MSKVDTWLRQVEERAAEEGPEAVAELESLRERFRFAQMVMSRRRQLGLTQSELAHKCGLDQAEISRIECGRANPTFDTLHTLAHALEREVCLSPKRNDASPSSGDGSRAPQRKATPGATKAAARAAKQVGKT